MAKKNSSRQSAKASGQGTIFFIFYAVSIETTRAADSFALTGSTIFYTKTAGAAAIYTVFEGQMDWHVRAQLFFPGNGLHLEEKVIMIEKEKVKGEKNELSV